jgi:hypothetical protein
MQWAVPPGRPSGLNSAPPSVESVYFKELWIDKWLTRLCYLLQGMQGISKEHVSCCEARRKQDRSFMLFMLFTKALVIL